MLITVGSLAHLSLAVAAHLSPRGILVAGIYPDRPWEGAPAAEHAKELERRLAQLEADLSRSRHDLARTQTELESQQARPAQPVAKAPTQPGHAGKHDLARLRLSVSLLLWALLGFASSYRMYAGSAVPAFVCLLFALAGGAVSLVELVQDAVDAVSRRWGDTRPERQLQCYNCAKRMRVPKGSTSVACPFCGAVNKATKSFY